jgi:hypothetical protein
MAVVAEDYWRGADSLRVENSPIDIREDGGPLLIVAVQLRSNKDRLRTGWGWRRVNVHRQSQAKQESRRPAAN